MPWGATKIRRLRRRHGWTQQELASRIAVDPMTVSRWERGVSSPRGRLREVLAQLADDLTGPERDPSPAARSGLRAPAESPHPDIDELVRIVGVERARSVLRREVLLRRAAGPARFPVDPDVRLRELDAMLRDQSELIERAKIG